MYDFDDLDDVLIPKPEARIRERGRFVFLQAISADAEALDDGPRLSDAELPPVPPQRGDE